MGGPDIRERFALMRRQSVKGVEWLAQQPVGVEMRQLLAKLADARSEHRQNRLVQIDDLACRIGKHDPHGHAVERGANSRILRGQPLLGCGAFTQCALHALEPLQGPPDFVLRAGIHGSRIVSPFDFRQDLDRMVQRPLDRPGQKDRKHPRSGHGGGRQRDQDAECAAMRRGGHRLADEGDHGGSVNGGSSDDHQSKAGFNGITNTHMLLSSVSIVPVHHGRANSRRRALSSGLGVASNDAIRPFVARWSFGCQPPCPIAGYGHSVSLHLGILTLLFPACPSAGRVRPRRAERHSPLHPSRWLSS